MNLYPQYKPSGIDWLGNIPSHWATVKTKWLYDTIGSGTTPTSGADEFYLNGTVNWLQTGDLNNGIVKSTSKKITDYAVATKGLKIYPKGSLVIAMYGATIAKLGFLAIDTAVNQACCVLSSSKKIDNKFAFYYFAISKDELISLSSGGGQPNISQAIISDFKVVVPPLGEQEAIAGYLDEVTARIDALVAERKRQLEDLRSYRTSLITETVTHGLNPDAPLRPSGIDWLGQIPTHWTKTRLKYFITQITTPSLSDRKVALENIESNTGRYIESSSEFEGNGVEFKAGDILYGKLRPYLKKVWLAEFDGNAIGDFFVYRPNDNANGRYVKWLFLSHGFSSIVNQSTDGAKMPRVSSDFIKSLCYYLPPLSEQQEIADYLDVKTAKIDALAGELVKELDELALYKQAVITEAVTGKVDVRDYKPNNESHAHAS